jgi:hypothetical protein
MTTAIFIAGFVGLWLGVTLGDMHHKHAGLPLPGYDHLAKARLAIEDAKS